MDFEIIGGGFSFGVVNSTPGISNSMLRRVNSVPEVTNSSPGVLNSMLGSMNFL